MPVTLVRKVLVCLAVAAPAIVVRVTGVDLAPILGVLVFGAGVVGAAFLLAWAAEAAQKDISGTLAIALLALVAVLPEYAVDLYYAYTSGSNPSYLHFAAANMTGSNRLLLGLGWPLVVLVSVAVGRRTARRRGRDDGGAGWTLLMRPENRMDVGALALLGLVAFLIPILGVIPLWFGVLLIAFFIYHLWRSAQVGQAEEEEFIGTAALITGMATRARRVLLVAMFVVAASVILACAEPFADSLVGSGAALHVDSYFLVQWLAPLASEAPEFIIAVLFALRGKGAAAIGTLIASKVNQWSLLVGSLPVAHLVGGGGAGLPMDGRQIEEFTLTATQTLLGVSMILALRFGWRSAALLLGLFALQFGVTGTTGRYLLSAVHVAVAIGFLIWNRRAILATLASPFARIPHPRDPGGQGAGRLREGSERVEDPVS